MDATHLGGYLAIDDADAYIKGNVTLSLQTLSIFSSNVTRIYNVVAIDMIGNPLGNAELNLYGLNGTSIWNGITDSSGKTSFNLTFTDANYNDDLTLVAAKGNLFTRQNITLLSNTPVIIKFVLGDINGDSIVDMKDVGTAARAFMTQPGDPYWNPHVDITGPESLVPDGKVDMRDISLVARHFGEHYP